MGQAAGKGGPVSSGGHITGSMLASTFLLAGAQALGILTAPGPKRGTAKDFSYPPGEATDVIPYVIGEVELVPHLVTYFDYDNKEVKNDVAQKEMWTNAGLMAFSTYLAMGGHFGTPTPDPPSAYQGIGLGAVLGAITAKLGELRTWSYRHYCAFFYELCHGPIDGISAIKVSERIVYAGTDSNAGNSILIDDPQAWGGDHVDGGVYALCDIVKGDFWPLQQPNPYTTAQLGSSVPSYSGKACFIIRGPSGFRESGFFAANPGAAPALRPIKFRVHRYPNNLGVPDFKKVNVDGYHADGNPAEACYEWLTSPAFGVKKFPTSKIDLDSFRSGAETHFNEGLGISDQFNTQVDVETALDNFCALSDSLIYGSLRRGNVKYKPIRRDYSIPSLKLYRRGPDGSDPSLYNVIRREEFTAGSWASTFNNGTFRYKDRDNNFIETARPYQDLANYMIQGKVRSVDQDLTGVSNGTTAALVGTREMRAGTFPRPPLTLVTNRDGFDEEPGNVIQFIDNVDDFTKVLRVAEVQTGTEDSSECHLVCVEDQYGVGASAFNPFVPAGFTDPVGTAVAAANAKVLEAPYFLTRDDDPKLLVFAGKPSGSQINFDTYVSTDGGTTYGQESSRTSFAITGTITEAIERLTDPVLDSLTFTPTNAFDATRLASATEADIGANQNIIYFEDSAEFMAVETITENEDGTYTLENIWRAVHPYDSVPNPHSAGARVWFFTYGKAITGSEYADGTATKTKVLPRTVSAQLQLASASAISVTVGDRALSPNPVRGVSINGESLEAEDIGAATDVDVEFFETNRLTEGLIVKQDEAGTTPEDGTTYTARYYATEGGGNVLLRTETGITASTGTINISLTTAEEAASPNYLGHLAASYRVEIDPVRDGHTGTTYIREKIFRGSAMVINGIPVTIESDDVVVT